MHPAPHLTRAPRVACWVERVMGISTYDAPDQHAAADGDDDDDGSGSEEVPATLEAVLLHMLREFVPVLRSTAALFVEQGYSEGQRVDRVVGAVSFEVAGRIGQRAALTFMLWMAGKVFDVLHEDGVGADSDGSGGPGAAYLRRAFGEDVGGALLELAPGFAPGGALRVRREQNILVRGYAPPGTPYTPYCGEGKETAGNAKL